MFLKIKKLLITIGILSLGLTGRAWAAPASASLSMAGGSYAPGATFSVDVIENSGTTAINIVESDLDFDNTQLEFVSLDTSSGDFPNGVPNNADAADIAHGRVNITVFNLNKVKGSAKVATVTFRHLGGDSSSVTVDKSSAAVLTIGSTKNIWDGVVSPATFNFVAPQPAAQPVSPPVPPAGAGSQPAPINRLTPVTTTGPAQPLSAAPSVKSLSTKAVIPFESMPLNTEPESRLYDMLLAAGLAAAAMVALYFDAHLRAYRHAQQRLTHKMMLLSARLKVKYRI